MKLQKDLREFLELLGSSGVEFIIVGGHAVAFHGFPRFTGDIDVLVRPEPANAHRLLDALNAFGFSGQGLTERDFVERGRVTQLGRPPNRIDILTEISGVDFDEAWQGRVRSSLDGVAVDFLGRDELVRNKRASGRTKDKLDLEALGED